ncbi:hypothetical protein GCM10010869_10330 [Mesorhizobium tianshanense]|uniref:Uncharacterized protein n=1 Tax=Mesorhizobium tianshanense TaxID=39844 RepID=A0A562N465_9HYPH|nr:HEPN domain-containing protein [Mesorhizobium tianshanense]TWI26967.1 hypothetical protein IQ26_05663 [Mesorhizobium tianshanense]GLS35445.1 hypothetical protein GCM10010869_10330 [Mesorhizobium tianshanense]
MSSNRKAKKPSFDNDQKKELKQHAIGLMRGLLQGAIRVGDPKPFDFGELGGTFFEGFTARFTPLFVEARREFVVLAARMLKAKSAHEPTLLNLCLTAAQNCIKQLDPQASPQKADETIDHCADKLVADALAEGGKEYIEIAPNFLIAPNGYDGPIKIGRVTSMRTDDAVASTTALAGNKKVTLVKCGYPNIEFVNGALLIGMPAMVFVVEVPAARQNVAEEAKWLIDVAISFIRLMGTGWSSRFPGIGDIEPHPTLPTDPRRSHVTINGTTVSAGGAQGVRAYDVDLAIAAQLSDQSMQELADLLFDATEKALAGRVAQGLGWITRGRQSLDRAERLLAFFTALEALLTNNDTSAPVTQTISRFVSIICTNDIETRVEVFNQVKSLYGVRSKVVHGGKREVLWKDVNVLQGYVEVVFQVVLKQCDLTMAHSRFNDSLAVASHGLPWEFALPENVATGEPGDDADVQEADSAKSGEPEEEGKSGEENAAAKAKAPNESNETPGDPDLQPP